MMKNVSGREKILAITTISVAALALSYSLIVEPLMRHWENIDTDIRDKEVLLIKHSRIMRNKPTIEKIHKEHEKYFLNKSVSQEKDSAEALSTIEKIAGDTNTYITNIKPLTVKKYEGYAKLTFRVTAESSVEGLLKFMYDLQSSNQLLKVERMVLRAKEKSPDVIKAVLHITKVSIL